MNETSTDTDHCSMATIRAENKITLHVAFCQGCWAAMNDWKLVSSSLEICGNIITHYHWLPIGNVQQFAPGLHLVTC